MGAVQPDRAVAYCNQFACRNRIAAGEQRDGVSLSNQLLGQIRDDPLGPAI